MAAQKSSVLDYPIGGSWHCSQCNSRLTQSETFRIMGSGGAARLLCDACIQREREAQGTAQPKPRQEGGRAVTPAARADFNDRLTRREEYGIRKYGRTLHTHNGRNPYQDAKEEMIDNYQYLVQAEMEHEDLVADYNNAMATAWTAARQVHTALQEIFGLDAAAVEVQDVPLMARPLYEAWCQLTAVVSQNSQSSEPRR